MQVFQDLTIRLVSTDIPSFVERLEEHLQYGWKRDKAKEAEFTALAVLTKAQFCFVLEGAPNYSPAFVWLASRTPSELYVPNILSGAKFQLSQTEYNEILNRFAGDVASPAADEGGDVLEVSKAEIGLEDLVPPEAAEALRNFSGGANKTTGSAHPADRERWLAFLVLAHQAEATMDAEMLRRWLQEEEKWPEEEAWVLMAEYHFALHVLQYYDGHR